MEREMPEGTKPAIGACRYCGQTRAFPDGGNWSEKELDEAATGLCKCADAQRAREAEKRQKDTVAQVREIFRKDIEILNLMEELVPPVLSGEIRKVTIESDDGVKAAMSLTRSGKVSVSRKQTSSRAVTV